MHTSMCWLLSFASFSGVFAQQLDSLFRSCASLSLNYVPPPLLPLPPAHFLASSFAHIVPQYPLLDTSCLHSLFLGLSLAITPSFSCLHLLLLSPSLAPGRFSPSLPPYVGLGPSSFSPPCFGACSSWHCISGSSNVHTLTSNITQYGFNQRSELQGKNPSETRHQLQVLR